MSLVEGVQKISLVLKKLKPGSQQNNLTLNSSNLRSRRSLFRKKKNWSYFCGKPQKKQRTLGTNPIFFFGLFPFALVWTFSSRTTLTRREAGMMGSKLNREFATQSPRDLIKGLQGEILIRPFDAGNDRLRSADGLG